MTRREFKDREGEASEYFTIKIPKRTAEMPAGIEQKTEKTSLYVPKEQLDNNVHFERSGFSDEVLVTRDITGVLETVFKHGAVATRYGDNGLEDDPSRQQIIVYTAVKCGEGVLWYQRSTPETAGKKDVGDPRLEGRYSLGFGGHKTKKDIAFNIYEQLFLNKLMPVIRDNLGMILGLGRGFFAEVEEELGLDKEGVKGVNLLGAFKDLRIEDPSVKVQVGWVHTAIAAELEIDPSKINRLRLRKSEMAKAWWSKTSGLGDQYKIYDNAWKKGKGPKVETWSEIMIKEFLR